MDYSLTGEQQMLQAMFRDFAAGELAKAADKVDREEAIPARHYARAAAQGFMGALVPEEPYGGAALDLVGYTLLMEALAFGCASTALTLHVHNALALGALLRHAGESAQAGLIPEMVAGRRLGAFALTEPGAGADPSRLRTIARREGDGYRLTGTKSWVSNGGKAGVYLIFAATDPAAGARGLSAFAVAAETPGLTVGGREPTLGLRGASITRLYLRDCRVPESYRLGGEGDGYRIALQALDYGRVGIAAAALGIARRALEAGVRYAGERKQFGTPIGTKQAIQVFLADSATELAAAEGLVRHAAWLADQGGAFTQEAATAKLFASRMAAAVTDRMVQLHGGAGYVVDFPIERLYRDARALELAEGTSQILQIVIAGNMLAGAGVKVRP